MTASELYTSLKSLYKNMMFPKSEVLPNGQIVKNKQWALSEIDQLDVHFFNELMDFEVEEQQHDQEVYLSDIW